MMRQRSNSRFAMALAIGASVVTAQALWVQSAHAVLLFSEDFEAPDVTSAQSTGTTNKTTPSSWVRHGGVFGADRHGIVDKAAGAFSAPAGNDQAYAFRYTSSPGITSGVGVISAIEAGVTYTLSFDVQQDLGDPSFLGGTADANHYSAQFVAHDAGDNRSLANSIDGTLLDSVFGSVALDGQFHTITMSWTADPIAHAGLIGQDLAIRFKDVWQSGNTRASGVIDNIVVENDVTAAAPVPEPATAALGLIGLAGLMMRRRRLA